MDEILNKIKEIHAEHPSLRFGQILGNALPQGDHYYTTDEEVLDYLNRYQRSVAVL